MKPHSRLLYIIYIPLILSSAGCKKLVTVDPPITSITGENVYTSDGTAIAVLTAIYAGLSNGSASFATGASGITLLASLSADELKLTSGVTNVNLYYYTNALSSTNIGSGTDLWAIIYQRVYMVNAAIQGLTNNKSLTPAVQQQLLGEALFIRAFCYSYLINLYGDVPLVIETDYVENSVFYRTPKDKVSQQIISDLTTAQTLLNQNYLDATLLVKTTEKVRPTKWAAKALLARVYLYTGDYNNAKAQADSVINNTSLFGLDTLNGTFLKNSREGIWQLQPVTTTGTTNTQDAYIFTLPASGPNTGSQPVCLSQSLLRSFEAGDQRKLNWVNSVIVGKDTFYYPYKYKTNGPTAPVKEYLMVLRLGEQLLIRAEAEANGADGGLSAAVADLNLIRKRANLGIYIGGMDQSSVLNAIYHERQVELFTEWGHRWFDLKRTGKINAVMGSPGNVCQAKGGGTWNPDWQLYPISSNEIQFDKNLVQNSSY